MNGGSNCKSSKFKRHSEVLLNWSKTAFVHTVFKLFKRRFSYTRLNAKLGFSETSFVNTAVIVLIVPVASSTGKTLPKTVTTSHI